MLHVMVKKKILKKFSASLENALDLYSFSYLVQFNMEDTYLLCKLYAPFWEWNLKSNFTFLRMEMSVGEPKLKPCINLQ